MANSIRLAVPKKERLEVQIHDDTDEHNIVYAITSLATIKGDKIFKNFRLYAVKEDGSLELLEKHDGEPHFDALKGTVYES